MVHDDEVSLLKVNKVNPDLVVDQLDYSIDVRVIREAVVLEGTKMAMLLEVAEAPKDTFPDLITMVVVNKDSKPGMGNVVNS